MLKAEVKPTGGTPVPLRRERWITIGEVYWPHYVMALGWGTPWGFRMCWNGRTDVFQAWEFRNYVALITEVERRCRMARLEAAAVATGVEAGFKGLRELRVLVRRVRSAECGMKTNHRESDTWKEPYRAVVRRGRRNEKENR